MLCAIFGKLHCTHIFAIESFALDRNIQMSEKAMGSINVNSWMAQT